MNCAEGTDGSPHQPDRASGSRLIKWLQVSAFWLMIPALVVVVATLMVGHWVTLPKPAADDEHLRQALAQLRSPAEQEQWVGIHVLYSDCGCSRRVLDHLFSSERPAGFAEKLLLVGHHEEFEAGARAAGLDVTVLRARELKEQFGLESAPLFIVADPAGTLRYVGGYTERKRGLAIRDLEIVRELRAGGESYELPLFGCAVSQRLQEILDPLGIKYSSVEQQ